MNLPPMKIGRNFRINNDIVEMFRAFGIRSEANVIVDMKARCTTADRVRVRIQEMCIAKGKTLSPAYSAVCWSRLKQALANV